METATMLMEAVVAAGDQVTRVAAGAVMGAVRRCYCRAQRERVYINTLTRTKLPGFDLACFCHSGRPLYGRRSACKP